MSRAPEYYIHASWGPRAETPEVIAARFLACIDRLKQIHPAYDNWIFRLNDKPKKFDALRKDLPAAIAANVVRADNGKPTPSGGYWSRVVNNMNEDGPRSLAVSVKAGSTWAGLAIRQKSEPATKLCQILPSSPFRHSRRRYSLSSRVSTPPIAPPIRCR